MLLVTIQKLILSFQYLLQDQDVTTMLADDFIPWEGSSLSCKFIEKIIDNGIVDHFDRKTSLENALEGVR